MRSTPIASPSQSAWAGILGPALFTAVFLVHEAVPADRYDRVAEVVSALEAGPYGWIQQAQLRGLRDPDPGVRRRPASCRAAEHGWASPDRPCSASAASRLLLAAMFPLREDANGVTYDPGGHVVAGVMFFLTSAIGLVVLSRRLARDPPLAGLDVHAGRGPGAVAGFVLMGAFVMPDDAPLHDWAGLAQRP